MARTTLTTPACALALAASWLLGPITQTGAWDPVEADAADLARRIAVSTFGATSLARSTDPAASPTLTDLGMGELPYTSMAASFRLFGFHEWAGRLPLALWGIAGAMSLYWLLHRLVHPRAGFYAVAALSTMPLYFLHARTMPGEIVAMAGFAMAVSGASLALVEDRWAPRLAAVALAGLGVVAGFLSRGLLLGVATPVAVAGISGLIAPRAPSSKPIAHRLGALGLSLAAAAVAVAFARVLWSRGDPELPLSRVLGVAIGDPTPTDSTFDRIVRQIGHAIFPWTAVALVALGRLFVPTRAGEGSRSADYAAFARVVLLLGASATFLAATFLVPHTGALPYLGAPMIAGAIGVAALDLERCPPSRLAAFAFVGFTLLVWVDLDREPSRALSPFMVEPGAFPTSSLEPSRARLGRIVPGLVLFGFFCLFDGGEVDTAPASGSLRQRFQRWVAERRREAATLGKELYDAFQGNLVFAFVVIEAALVGLGAMMLIGSRARWDQITKLPQGVVSLGSNAWWAVPLGVVGGLVGFVLVRDGVRAIVRVARVPRGAVLVIAGSVAGAAMSFGFYPALGEELSPKSAFSYYARTHAEGEPLALLGMSPRSGALYFDHPLPVFDDVQRAASWLGEDGEARRYLVLKATDLPRLNSLWRGRYRKSVSVLDSRSSQNILVSNVGGGEVPEGTDPFAGFLFDQPPSVAHPMSARLLDHIEILGWEIVDAQGTRVDVVVPQKPYRVRIVFKILKRVPGSWLSFVHIDGKDKRYNADHVPLGGKYPMNLWLPGDILRDEVEVTLEPNFVPGEYWLFFGFFQGEARMQVTDGPAKDNRIVGGKIEVR